MEKSTSRLKVLAILVTTMFAALSTRLWFLQVLDSAAYAREAENQMVRLVPTDAPRGRILDANGDPLVDNRLSVEVRVNEQELANSPDAEAILLRLSEVLGMKVHKINEALDSKLYYDYQPVPVAVDVPKKVAFYLEEHADLFPGVQVVRAAVRNYPEGSLAAHELGWVGQIYAEEIDQEQFARYGPNDLVGKAGLEKQYEKYLVGTKGKETYQVNSAGETIRQLGGEDPVPGDDVILALDGRIQRIAEDALVAGIERARGVFDESSGRNLTANSGTVIVLDVNDGGVVAMASYPNYSPSWFVEGLTPMQNQYLYGSDQRAPMLNRATQLTFAPGSTFKPFIALSAVRNELATLTGYYPCPGSYEYPGDTSGTVFDNWTSANSGSITVGQALKVSCDTVFYQFGADFYDRWRNNQFGATRDALPLQRDLRQFGFGSATGIDLPGEASGLIPTPKWKEAFAKANPDVLREDEQSWLPGDDILMSIGQGFVTVTPMQLAVAYAALANGGKVCEPHLADRIVDANGDLVRKVTGHCGQRRLPYSEAELDYIVSSLATVPEPGGTADSAFVGFPLSEYPIAGKTGTAQREPFQDTSWFAAVVPATDPQYVVIAMVEQGGHGSTTAAPIVRQVIEQIYGIESTGTAAPPPGTD
jgi:penicillin-binding protein 2